MTKTGSIEWKAQHLSVSVLNCDRFLCIYGTLLSSLIQHIRHDVKMGAQLKKSNFHDSESSLESGIIANTLGAQL